MSDAVRGPMARPEGAGYRRVPLLFEPSVGHYDEFRQFFVRAFGLDGDPLGPAQVVQVAGRYYEFVFVGRSGEQFPSGLEISALAPSLEPLEAGQLDADLLSIMRWIVASVGGVWTESDLVQAAAIFRVGSEPAGPAAGHYVAGQHVD